MSNTVPRAPSFRDAGGLGVNVVAIIPAAGSGVRLGGAAPKQYVALAGMPMLARTLAAFESSAVIRAVVVVAPPGDETRCRAVAIDPYGWKKILAVVPGGAARQESVARGLDAVGADASIVVVHDAARPLVSDDLIRRVVDAARASGAAVAAIPIVDTLKRRIGDLTATVDREGLWAAQTPQAFRAELLREAVARARADGFTGTDDAALVERLGRPVTLVAGEPENFKITRSEDLTRAEEIVAMRTARAARQAERRRPVRRSS
ncbi:MAG: 2-C-methyl-D-erythritol 4-phosphate cytidylyltransferase [Nitrospirota bacterium]